MSRIRIQRTRDASSPDSGAGALRATQGVTLIGRLPGGQLPDPSVSRAYRAYNELRGNVVETAISEHGMAERLPGLREGSPLRDMARMALAGGAPVVHVLLHDYVDPAQSVPVVAGMLEDFPLATLLLGDLSEDLSDRSVWGYLASRHLEGWREELRERYQVACFDLPSVRFDRWGRVYEYHDLAGQVDELRSRIQPTDAAAFAWTGSAASLRQHGWRSPSALAAGALAGVGDGSPATRLLQQEVLLPPGRRVEFSKALVLDDESVWRRDLPPRLEPIVNLVELSDDARRATFRGQVLLREGWEIPAQRTLRYFHFNLWMAASDYVFANATQAEALALAQSLEGACSQLTAANLVVGDGEGGLPVITARPEMHRSGPTLVADISARLQPWGREIDVRFQLGGGALQVQGEV